ncbi:hypothetical protein SDC9_77455 [bioreactor metagenome]|uniref:Uncharacterized protein n=1 Tax=bioreactor metagenome TaxID=1076179 RepID=A0A644YQL2_9ZZZZ
MEAIIGVIGTILGTILGWVLNSVSNHGKLYLYVSSWDDNFLYNEVGCLVPCISKEKAEYYSYKLTLDIYNSSSEARIMRDITIIYSDDKCELHKSVPKDDTTRYSSGSISFYNDIAPVNIPPKAIIQLKLHDGSHHQNNGLDYIWKTRKIYLTYKNEKSKTTKIAIKSEDYSCYFENHK